MLLKIQNIQILKIRMLENLNTEIKAEISNRYPIFSISSIENDMRVAINSSSWNFVLFSMRHDPLKFEEMRNTFLSLDQKQYILFSEISKALPEHCPLLTKLLGEKLCAVILSELGSVKRLVEIPSKNLKGIGYVKNLIHNQLSYLSYHPILLNSRSINTNKILREICNRTSKAAKLDYFKHESTHETRKKILLSRKEINKLRLSKTGRSKKNIYRVKKLFNSVESKKHKKL